MSTGDAFAIERLGAEAARAVGMSRQSAYQLRARLRALEERMAQLAPAPAVASDATTGARAAADVRPAAE